MKSSKTLVKMHKKNLKNLEKSIEAKYAERELDSIKLRSRTLTELNIKIYKDSNKLYEAMKLSALGDPTQDIPMDWRAGNALFDRAYGKAKETVDLNGNVVFSLKGLAEKRAQLEQEETKLLNP